MPTSASLRVFIAAILLALAAAFVVLPASAQRQPAEVNPTAQSVKERQLLNEVQRIQGRGTLPDTRSRVLEQPEGRAWREFRTVTLRWIGAIAILGMLALLVAFYLIRGMVKIENGRSGRTLVRFNAFERFVHWMTAGSFVVLALSGLNITFGRELILPLIGPAAFTGLSQWAKYAHNFLSFPFTIGVIVMFLMWLAWNLPTPADLRWIAQGGGIVGDSHPPAKRFNAGQKAIYWVVVLGGGATAITGYLLMFPFYVTDIAGMQTAQMVHAVVGLLFIAIMLAHIYIGTIGEQGAFEAMGSGSVDVNWARQHHSLWLEQEAQRGRVSGGATPAE
ncbi:MAG TPA: formate dehydrogenase subunit gamma [Hyphomicrobiaceae bacterium]|nr:formate dehydrogenase subunit gamma [Hyphomicrobiaceae bacterium]